MNFIFHNSTKVYFGDDQLQHLGPELAQYGKRVLLVYGSGSIKRMGLYDRVMAEMAKADLEVFELSGVEPNPRVTTVNAGGALCRQHDIDVVLAVGGGSTIDCAKYICAAAFYEGDAWDFLIGQAEVTDALPLVDILTLAATGSEMNRNAVISNLETQQKIGGGHELFLPKASFLDPTNTYTVSKYQTASGSADILSHIMEVYFAPDPGMYMLDSMMEGLMRTVIRYAPIAMEKPDDYEARANLMWAGTWAINGFIRGANNHSWSNHSMEHPLSAYYDIAHGHGLAILTPRWMEYVLDEETAPRFYRFGTEVFGLDPAKEPMEVAKEAIAKLSDFFFKTLELDSTLTDLGIDDSLFDPMADQALRKGKGTIHGFKTLKKDDVMAIYRMCL